MRVTEDTRQKLVYASTEIATVKPNVAGAEVYVSVLFFVENLSVSLSPTLNRNEKVKHHIKTKIHKFIILRFWIKSSVNTLYG